MSIYKAIDEETEFVERCILDGGLVGKKLANRLAGYSVGSNHIYKLANSGRIESYAIGGTIYFSAIDCVMWRRKKTRLGGYAEMQNQTKYDAALKARQN